MSPTLLPDDHSPSVEDIPPSPPPDDHSQSLKDIPSTVYYKY